MFEAFQGNFGFEPTLSPPHYTDYVTCNVFQLILRNFLFLDTSFHLTVSFIESDFIHQAPHFCIKNKNYYKSSQITRSKNKNNKKVLLRERKRHTARHVASTRF